MTASVEESTAGDLAAEVAAIAGLDDPSEIGRGANAVVYRAWQPRLERHVAVKILVTPNTDEVSAGRFAREVKALAALSWHPNIITLLDAGTSPGGHAYLVTSLLSGGTLHDRVVAEGPLPADEVVAIGASLCDALSAAHRSNVLHRDLKPSNVLLSASGQPELADFGIASLGVRDLTRTGWFVGALSYTPPEVMMGERATTASDVWALAATLVTLLRGDPPWPDRGDGLVALLERTRTEPPPDLTGHGLPSAAADLLRRSLDPDPAQRPTLAELQRALDVARHPTSGSVPVVDPTAQDGAAAPDAAIDLGKPSGDAPPSGADATRIDSTAILTTPPIAVATSSAPPAPPAAPPAVPPAGPAAAPQAPPPVTAPVAPAPQQPPAAWPSAPGAAPPQAGRGGAAGPPQPWPHGVVAAPVAGQSIAGPPPRASTAMSTLRVAATALVAAGAGVLALSTAVPWVGTSPMLTDDALAPTGMLVLVVAAQWVLLVLHAARVGARACFVGMVGVVGIGLAASATRTSADISADPFAPPGVALAAIAATLAGAGFLLLASTATTHRVRGWRSSTPWVRTIAIVTWSIGVLVGLVGSPWFGVIENGDWRAEVVWFRQGAPWVPLVACGAVQLLVLARPFSHSRFSAPLIGAGTAAAIAVATGLDTLPRASTFEPLDQSPMVLALGITTVCATFAALSFLSLLTFDAGRPSPPSRRRVAAARGGPPGAYPGQQPGW